MINDPAGKAVPHRASVRPDAGHDNYREPALNRLTKAQQIDVLKFAEMYQIKPSDPTWLLVDLLGHVRFYTDTLPARIEAAASHAAEAINQQRLLEQKAFSKNVLTELDNILHRIAPRVAVDMESLSIKDKQMSQRLTIHSLLAINGMVMLMGGSVVCGYLIARGNIYWGVRPGEPILNAVSLLFNLPVGYLIIPGAVIALVMFGRHYWSLFRSRDKWR